MGKIFLILLFIVFISVMGCTTTIPSITENQSLLPPNVVPNKNPSPAQEIADQFIAHEESTKLYSANGTVAVLRNGTPRYYSFTLYAQRPDHYYLGWADATGNSTDIFITNGWDEYYITPALNQTWHHYKDFNGATKYSKVPTYDSGYDILELITSYFREGRENVTRNFSAEDEGEYSVCSARSSDGSVTHMTIDRTDYSVKKVAIYGPGDNPVMAIKFDDIEHPSQFPGSRFELPAGSGNIYRSATEGYNTPPLFPIYNPLSPASYPYKVSLSTPTPSTPSTTPVPGT
jgi:outer membrane lipoprotein-sorting protein